MLTFNPFRAQQDRWHPRVRAAEVASRHRHHLPLKDEGPRQDRLRGRHPGRRDRIAPLCQGQ